MWGPDLLPLTRQLPTAHLSMGGRVIYAAYTTYHNNCRHSPMTPEGSQGALLLHYSRSLRDADCLAAVGSNTIEVAEDE